LNEARIRLERAQSALFERLAAAMSELNDPELSSLTLLEVKLARGRRDAHLYIDAAGVSKSDQTRLVAKLKKASGFLAGFVTANDGWFKSPALHFVFDDTLEKAAHLEQIFKEIHRDGEP
jgi:ribosome-binding factor A